MRLLAGHVLVRRAVQKPDVPAPAALLAGVAFDVLPRQIGECLSTPSRHLGCRRIATVPSFVQCILRLGTRLGQCDVRVHPERQSAQPPLVR